MKKTLSIALIAFAPFLCGAGEQKEAPDGSAFDISLTRTSVKKGGIKSHKLTVSDWSIRLANNSSKPRWIQTVSQKTSSKYLIERNPEQVSYRVFEKRGKVWVDTQIGWSMLIGPKAKWLKIKPGEKFDFVIPIFDRFETEPASIRLEIQITEDPTGKKVGNLVTRTFEHNFSDSP